MKDSKHHPNEFDDDEGYTIPSKFDNNPEEAETRFDGDENEESITLHESIPDLRSGFKKVGRAIGSEMRRYTQQKKDFLKDNLGIKLNKTAGPFSKILFDNIRLTLSADRKTINGLEYKRVKVVVFSKGKFDYATAKAKADIWLMSLKWLFKMQ